MTMTAMMTSTLLLLLLLLASPIDAGLSSQEEQDILDLHNTLRAGEGASNMEKMKWNSQLAQLAQTWSDNCVRTYGQPQFDPATVGYAMDNIGQNNALYSDYKYRSVTGAVQGWFDEKPYYNYDYVSCSAPIGKSCGHYTQAVWAKSKEIGCGLTKCASIADYNFLVCNYGSAAKRSQRPFKKGAACSECNSGQFFCTSNLCDSSCSSAGQGSTCTCAAQCGSCGTQTSDCKCQCQPGWFGDACNVECRDNHPYCGASWITCDSASSSQYLLDDCPALCQLCQPATGGQTCSIA